MHAPRRPRAPPPRQPCAAVLGRRRAAGRRKRAGRSHAAPGTSPPSKLQGSDRSRRASRAPGHPAATDGLGPPTGTSLAPTLATGSERRGVPRPASRDTASGRRFGERDGRSSRSARRGLGGWRGDRAQPRPPPRRTPGDRREHAPVCVCVCRAEAGRVYERGPAYGVRGGSTGGAGLAAACGAGAPPPSR